MKSRSLLVGLIGALMLVAFTVSYPSMSGNKDGPAAKNAKEQLKKNYPALSSSTRPDLAVVAFVADFVRFHRPATAWVTLAPVRIRHVVLYEGIIPKNNSPPTI